MNKTTTLPLTENEHLFADLDKPSLVGLSYALRHPELWPAEFHWNYRSCDTCAMGLAHQLWNQIPRGSNDANMGASIMAKAFGIPFAAAQNVFMGRIGGEAAEWVPTKDIKEVTGALWWKKETIFTDSDHKAITPEMVADQIDKYLVTAE